MERLLYNYREQFRFQFPARHLKWWVVAKAAGISRQSFFDIEQGNKLPTEEELNQIKAVFREYDPSLTGFPDIPIKQPKKRHIPDYLPYEFCIELHKYRESLGISRAKLALLSGVPATTINSFERGHVDIAKPRNQILLRRMYDGYVSINKQAPFFYDIIEKYVSTHDFH